MIATTITPAATARAADQDRAAAPERRGRPAPASAAAVGGLVARRRPAERAEGLAPASGLRRRGRGVGGGVRQRRPPARRRAGSARARTRRVPGDAVGAGEPASGGAAACSRRSTGFREAARWRAWRGRRPAPAPRRARGGLFETLEGLLADARRQLTHQVVGDQRAPLGRDAGRRADSVERRGALGRAPRRDRSTAVARSRRSCGRAAGRAGAPLADRAAGFRGGPSSFRIVEKRVREMMRGAMSSGKVPRRRAPQLPSRCRSCTRRLRWTRTAWRYRARRRARRRPGRRPRELKQPAGLVHGGVYAAIAESLASIGTARRRPARGQIGAGAVEPDELPEADHGRHDPRSRDPQASRTDHLGVGGRDQRRRRAGCAC